MRYTGVGIVIAAIIFMLPFVPRLGLLNGAVAMKMFFVVATTTILLIWVTLRARGTIGERLTANYLHLAIALLLTTQFVSAVAGVHFSHSLLGDVARSSSVLFFFHLGTLAVVSGLLLKKEDWCLVRYSLIASAALFSAITIIGVGGMGYAGKLLWLDLSALGVSFGNDTFAGTYLVLAVLFGAIGLFKEKSICRRIVMGLMVGVIALSPVLFSFSNLIGSARASSIALGIAGVFALGWWGIGFTKKRYTQKILETVWGLSFIAAFVAGSVLLILPGSQLQQQLYDETTASRFIVWERALDSIADRPIFGWGPENFDRAFEQNFDIRLYEKEGLKEVWFDKGHNVIIDTAVTGGVVAIIAVLLLLGAYVRAILKARNSGVIGRGEEALLLALPLAHLIQMQTAFDTVSTYILLALIGGYALSLDQTRKIIFKVRWKQGTYTFLVFLAITSLTYHLAYEFPRQLSLTASLSEPVAQKRSELISFAFSRVSDFEGLHRTSIHFTESVFDELDAADADERVTVQANTFLAQYLFAYERYLEGEPHHYRARMNYAYLLLLQTHWGRGRVNEAIWTIEDSYELSPGNPLTYVLHTMALSYKGDVEGASSKLNELITFAPNLSITKDTEAWLVKQRELHPEHSFLRIGNI